MIFFRKNSRVYYRRLFLFGNADAGLGAFSPHGMFIMLLAFDVGNTNIVFGIYKEHKLPDYWRVATFPSVRPMNRWN